MLCEDGSYDDKKEEDEVVANQVLADKLVIHGREGVYLMDKDKWPNLLLPHELEKQMVDSEPELECVTKISQSQGEIQANQTKVDYLVSQSQGETQPTLTNTGGFSSDGMAIGSQENLISDSDVMQSDLDLLDNTSIQSLDEILEDPTQQAWVSSAKKKKGKRKGEGKVVIATRASSRIPKDGRSILEKATQHAAYKDDTSTGTTSSNPFLVLSNLDNEYIHDVTVQLDLDVENIDTQIEVFRAKEKVRAALAEANYRKYLDSVNKKTVPQGEEELQEYTLEVIDNSARGTEDVITQMSPKVPPKRGRGRPKKKSK